MSDDFDANPPDDADPPDTGVDDKARPGNARPHGAHQQEWLTGAWGHRRAAPRFVAPPPGEATGDSVLDPLSPDAAVQRDSQARARRAGRRRLGVAVALVVLLAIGGGVYLGGRALIGQFTGSDAKDFTGTGVADVVVQVADGDSTGAVGKTLVDDNVVASIAAFTKAASKDNRIASLQPGFYRMRTQLPAADAVARLGDPASRVGKMVIPEGRQLDDVKGASGTITPGILSLTSAASCVDLDGKRQCASVADLRAVAATADPAALGIAEWARAGVTAAATVKERRLEGLIRPGSYDIEPGTSATAILKRLITRSATSLQLTGLSRASVGGLSPYQLLIVASLNEREVKPGEYAKVARVILNRLAIDQKLEFDSTVNYPLDVQAVATTPQDRATVTPWNTYASAGLPLTPIASPSDAAIQGALQPAAGNWHYFVTCGTEGATCFSDTYEQHLAVIAGGQGPP